MSFELPLKEGQLLALDSMLFVYHFEKEPRYFPVTSSLFKNIESGHYRSVTTVVTLMEVVVKPLQLGNANAAYDYQIVLNNFPNLTIVDINRPMAFLAAQLRAKYNIRLPDAMQLAGAITSSSDVFLTNDKKLKKVDEIKVIALSEL